MYMCFVQAEVKAFTCMLLIPNATSYSLCVHDNLQELFSLCHDLKYFRQDSKHPCGYYLNADNYSKGRKNTFPLSKYGAG